MNLKRIRLSLMRGKRLEDAVDHQYGFRFLDMLLGFISRTRTLRAKMMGSAFKENEKGLQYDQLSEPVCMEKRLILFGQRYSD
jgi:hypothetical protein